MAKRQSTSIQAEMEKQADEYLLRKDKAEEAANIDEYCFVINH